MERPEAVRVLGDVRKKRVETGGELLAQRDPGAAAVIRSMRALSRSTTAAKKSRLVGK